MDLYRFDYFNNKGHLAAKETPTALKFARHMYKKVGIYNHPISVTFPSGKVRQVVLVAKPNQYLVQTTEEVLCQSVLERGEDEEKWRCLIIADINDKNLRYSGDLYYVKHKDDKVYDVPRWVILRSPGRGSGQKVLHDLTQFQQETDKVYLITERWMKWGDRDICWDWGFEHSNVYDGDDYGRDGWTPWKGRQFAHFSSKNVSEFPYNPFAEGELAVPRNVYNTPHGEKLYIKNNVEPAVAVKSFMFKRSIAEAVFSPKRVEKMIDTFGIDWIETIA
jgi:hypothetical protein